MVSVVKESWRLVEMGILRSVLLVVGILRSNLAVLGNRADFEVPKRSINHVYFPFTDGLIQQRSLLKLNRDELRLVQLRGLASHSIQ